MSWGNARNWWPRVDVHTGFESVEDCIEHHRLEKKFRETATEEMRRAAVQGLSESAAEEKLRTEICVQQPLPHIVPTWCRSSRNWTWHDKGDRYKSWILVMPPGCSSWQDVVDKGLIQVKFDLDVTPDMETVSFDLGAMDDVSLIDREGLDGWVVVRKTGVDTNRPPLVQHLLCVREEPGGQSCRLRMPAILSAYKSSSKAGRCLTTITRCLGRGWAPRPVSMIVPTMWWSARDVMTVLGMRPARWIWTSTFLINRGAVLHVQEDHIDADPGRTYKRAAAG